MDLFAVEPRVTAIVLALFGIFMLLMVMAALDDHRDRKRKQREEQQDERMSTWVRMTTNPSDQAYNAWLNEHELSTWPYEVSLQPGYDERKDKA